MLKPVVCCVLVRVLRNGRKSLLVMQRRANQSYPLQWSIPGGKIEDGETIRRLVHNAQS